MQKTVNHCNSVSIQPLGGSKVGGIGSSICGIGSNRFGCTGSKGFGSEEVADSAELEPGFSASLKTMAEGKLESLSSLGFETIQKSVNLEGAAATEGRLSFFLDEFEI